MSNVTSLRPNQDGMLKAVPSSFDDDYFDKKGGGDDDGRMEARVAKLEASVEHIQRDLQEIKQDLREIKRDARSDFKLFFGALISVALGLAGMMAKGFHWI